MGLLEGEPKYPESTDAHAYRLGQRVSRFGTALGACGGSSEREGLIADTAAQRLAAANARIGSVAGVAPEMIAGLASAMTGAGLETARRLMTGEQRIDDTGQAQLSNLEAVVDAVERPAWSVVKNAPDIVLRDGSGRQSDEFWAVQVYSAGRALRRVCGRTGVIAKWRDGTAVPLATGWMIGPNTIVTNAHVAQLIAYRKPGLPAGDRRDRWRMSPDTKATIDFVFERDGDSGTGIEITDVLYVETSGDPDIAMFRLGDGSAAPPYLTVDLVPRPADHWSGARVFVVGHPIGDLRGDANVGRVFGPINGTKRFSPGEIRGVLGADTLEHDCSTTNGSSGSPVVDFASLSAVGLHYFGEPGHRNEAMMFSAYAGHPAIARAITGTWA